MPFILDGYCFSFISSLLNRVGRSAVAKSVGLTTLGSYVGVTLGESPNFSEPPFYFCHMVLMKLLADPGKPTWNLCARPYSEPSLTGCHNHSQLETQRSCTICSGFYSLVTLGLKHTFSGFLRH